MPNEKCPKLEGMARGSEFSLEQALDPPSQMATPRSFVKKTSSFCSKPVKKWTGPLWTSQEHVLNLTPLGAGREEGERGD